VSTFVLFYIIIISVRKYILHFMGRREGGLKCKCCYDLSLFQIMLTVQHQKLIPLLSIVLEAVVTYVTWSVLMVQYPVWYTQQHTAVDNLVFMIIIDQTRILSYQPVEVIKWLLLISGNYHFKRKSCEKCIWCNMVAVYPSVFRSVIFPLKIVWSTYTVFWTICVQKSNKMF
jgi:hypothetical protein